MWSCENLSMRVTSRECWWVSHEVSFRYTGGYVEKQWRTWLPQTSFEPLILVLEPYKGRDNAVGIATRYGLHVPGIEFMWGRDFPHPSRPALGPTQPPIQWVLGLSRVVNRPGHGVDYPPPSSPEVTERVELYLCSLSGSSWFVLRWTLTFKNRAFYIQDGRTATLQMLHFIYIFSTNISTKYFKHAAHSPFFSSKCRLFHNATYFGCCIIHILHTGWAKI
jgi:hypothetical protein